MALYVVALVYILVVELMSGCEKMIQMTSGGQLRNTKFQSLRLLHIKHHILGGSCLSISSLTNVRGYSLPNCCCHFDSPDKLGCKPFSSNSFGMLCCSVNALNSSTYVMLLANSDVFQVYVNLYIVICDIPV